MIKRLYSKRLKARKGAHVSDEDEDGLTPEQKDIKESILNRSQVTTGYWTNLWERYEQSFYWFFCCHRCCLK